MSLSRFLVLWIATGVSIGGYIFINPLPEYKSFFLHDFKYSILITVLGVAIILGIKLVQKHRIRVKFTWRRLFFSWLIFGSSLTTYLLLSSMQLVEETWKPLGGEAETHITLLTEDYKYGILITIVGVILIVGFKITEKKSLNKSYN